MCFDFLCVVRGWGWDLGVSGGVGLGFRVEWVGFGIGIWKWVWLGTLGVGGSVSEMWLGSRVCGWVDVVWGCAWILCVLCVWVG